MAKYLVLKESSGNNYQKIKSTESIEEARKTKEFYKKLFWRIVIVKVVK